MADKNNSYLANKLQESESEEESHKLSYLVRNVQINVA